MFIKIIKRVAILFLIGILIECLYFNGNTFLSLGGENLALEYELSDNLQNIGDGKYTFNGEHIAYIYLSGMKGELNYLFLDIECCDEDNTAVPLTVQIKLTDEGNSQMYELPSTSVYSKYEKLKYICADSYGNVENMQICISVDRDATISIGDILYNPRLPFFFSWKRLCLIYLVMVILWFVRPSSKLYDIKWNVCQKTILVCVVFLFNILLWHKLIQANTLFSYEVPWDHHKQYHKLAVAILEGEVSITVGIENAVSDLANPYDYWSRIQRLQKEGVTWDVGWDTAFYDGKFYVYFGVVPVLLMYLPYYVITGNAFPTWLGIWSIGCLLLAGVFYLLQQIVKNKFPDTPFLLYVILSVIFGNCVSTIMFMLRPDFYSLPIICAIAFSIWGLGLWFSAARVWEKSQIEGEQKNGRKFFCQRNEKVNIFIGSCSMALVAGCRPQFILGSFLVFAIFGLCIKKDLGQKNYKRLISNVVVGLMPYIVVGFGLMYYNYIRFASPFNFGANYNLTFNDMTRRGFEFGRLADGLFMYLFQFPNIGINFPFVHSTEFHSSYVGKTIRESMFGGVLFTNIILMVLFTIKKVKKLLKEKGLLGIVLSCIMFALVIVVVDTQMAGILNRYYADFLWLSMIAACIVILQMNQMVKKTVFQKYLFLFVIVSGILGIFMQLGMGFQISEISTGNEQLYYGLKSFLG